MTKKTLILLISFFALSFTTVKAGWYECYNFSGAIDKSPITLSIQMREGYFGEPDKKDFNVIGVYKYDKHNTPIRLEGRRNPSDNKIILYELSGEKQTAVFEFEFSEKESEGFWKNLSTAQKLPLNLKYVSKMNDLEKENEFSGVEVLQAESLKDFYFIGVYSKNKESEDAQMNSLKILRKKDNSLFQTLDLSKAESPSGNLMTRIFDNIEAGNKSKNFTISSKAGRMGGFLTVNYNARKKNFILNPKPTVEGPN